MNITLFKSVGQAYATKDSVIADVEWDDLVQLLCEHQKHEKKEHVPLFNLWGFKPVGPDATLGRIYDYEELTREDGTLQRVRTSFYKEIPNTVRRATENAIGLSGVVLDIDKDHTIEDAIAKYSDSEFLLYSTFNNTDKTNRFRIVFPFDRDMTAEEFIAKREDMAAHFKLVDHCSFSMTQSFYFHSGNHPYLHYNQGKITKVDDFKDEVIVDRVKVDQPQTNFNDDDFSAYKTALLDAINMCSNVRYTSGMTLVRLCRSINLSMDEFGYIVSNIGGDDSSIKDRNNYELLWQSTDGDKLTKEIRDKFLNEYGGKLIIKKKSYSEKDKLKYKLEQFKRRLR